MSFMDHLEPSARKRLEEVAEEVLVQDKELLIQRGGQSGDFYRVISGCLEVVDTSGAGEVVLDVLGPGTVVGEMGYLSGEKRSADVRAGEDTMVLRWRKEILDNVLETDLQLASAFYKASGLILSRRLDQLNRKASQGAIRAPVPESVEGARSVADSLKAELQKLELLLPKASPEEARERLAPVAARFVDSGRRMMAALSVREREIAGALMAQELQPYLIRSHLARMAITREAGHVGDAALLAHAEAGDPKASVERADRTSLPESRAERPGLDPFGRALDALLLAQPTVQSHRTRTGPALQRIRTMLSEMRVPSLRVTVLHGGSGTFVARLVTELSEIAGERSADLTVIDGSRENLAFLNSGTATRPPNVRIRPVYDDLTRICMGSSQIYFAQQDLIFVNGLAEYLPDRALAMLLRRLRDHLLPGGGMVMSLLTPSPESFVFDHLLTWRTVRRSPERVVQFCEGLRYIDAEVTWAEDAGAVVSARLPKDFQRTLQLQP